MFIHETHSFFIMFNLKNASESSLKKKSELLEKALASKGAKKIEHYNNSWMLNEVMFNSADDVFDIITNEFARLLAGDASLNQEEKKVLAFDEKSDKIVIFEYNTDNIFMK